MKKQVVGTFVVMGILIAGLGYAKYLMIPKTGPMMPPETVTTTKSRSETWERTIKLVGSILPSQGVTLSAEDAGKVVKLNFESGVEVQKGDVLIELDSAVEEARLKGAQARLESARKNYQRLQNLKATNAVSLDALDKAESDFRAAEAEGLSLQAVIARRKIVAPFTGRTGIRMVNVGEYVQAGEAIVPLHYLKEVFVNLNVPQQTSGLIGLGQEVNLSVDAFPGETFKGKVTAINPQLDPETRTLEVQATISNEKERLRPGMFATVNLILPEKDNVVVIPATSISYAPYGDTVYVVEAGKGPDGNPAQLAKQKVVKPGERRGDLVAIKEGLQPDEEVVTSGVFKLRNGSAVAINNNFSPGTELNPQPADS
jgi:membrane fusion protein, multidrug efflux system